MLDSVLIANRGEIACRIIRTCRRLGIRTIAVYSDADASARHVALADAAHRIGPPEAARSYLRPEAILEAARIHQAAAIHPGYGFLSERTELAEACADAGIAWVGPSPRCIAAMGSKIESKLLAADAGVAGVPGWHGGELSDKELLAHAEAIGFPVLIKASAGGGGKGMRRVDEPGRFIAELETARREARAAFGDDRVLLEKFIARPRHLEVQIAGDRHGNLIHLFERECSIQRNYQKVVEEAPAPHLPETVRAKLLDAAVRLGGAIGYDSLGTVEFILEAGGSEPYFLEMNTRLQVEHPVTEMTTGLDLVELQLRIAAGEALPLRQDEVRSRGHAIEVRVNAEDPSAGYRPQLGRVLAYAEAGGPGVRTDSGIAAGSEITPYYDSLLLKLIAHGPDREVARRRLATALAQTRLQGIGTNQAFLQDVVTHAAFGETLTTRFIAEAFPGGWQAPLPDGRALALAAVAYAAAAGPGGTGPWQELRGFRLGGRAGRPGRWRLRVAAGELAGMVIVSAGTGGLLAGTPEGGGETVTARWTDGGLLSDGGTIPAAVDGTAVHLLLDGRPLTLSVVPLLDHMAGAAKAAGARGSDVVSAMPGLVTAVNVAVGDRVEAGQTVVVMEAMKLVQPLAAPVGGIVRALHCKAGLTVAGGALLLEVEADAAA